MEVCDREQISLACLNPLFFPQELALGTVPVPAGVIGYPDMAALALIHMAAKLSSPAYFDCTHGAELV
jgi:hypothetical protein